MKRPSTESLLVVWIRDFDWTNELPLSEHKDIHAKIKNRRTMGLFFFVADPQGTSGV